MGYDSRVVSGPSLKGGDWAPSVHGAPRIATHQPFGAGQAEAPIAAFVFSDASLGEGILNEEV